MLTCFHVYVYIFLLPQAKHHKPSPHPPTPAKTRSLRAYSQRRTPDPSPPPAQLPPDPGPLSPARKAPLGRADSHPTVEEEGRQVRSATSSERGHGGAQMHISSVVIQSRSSGSQAITSKSLEGSARSTLSPLSPTGSGSCESRSGSSRESPISPVPRSSSSEPETSHKGAVSRESSTPTEELDTPEVKSIPLMRGGPGRNTHRHIEGETSLQNPTERRLPRHERGQVEGEPEPAHWQRELRERDEQLKKMSKENHRLEREKWELLRRARDAAERSLSLRTQLDMKEGALRAVQSELERARNELLSVKSANSSLRALLSDLRAPRSSVDVGVQVEPDGAFRCSPGFETTPNPAGMDEADGGGGEFERGSQTRVSTSTMGDGWSDRLDWTSGVDTSSYSELSRDNTPMPTPTGERRSKKKKTSVFGRMRRSTGKRGSITNMGK